MPLVDIARRSPLVSEFESDEQEASYLVWLQKKVHDSISDPTPNIPHDQVMAEARALLNRLKDKKHANG
jgi:hypothetical protein